MLRKSAPHLRGTAAPRPRATQASAHCDRRARRVKHSLGGSGVPRVAAAVGAGRRGEAHLRSWNRDAGNRRDGKPAARSSGRTCTLCVQAYDADTATRFAGA
eukprot:NODE_15622_length_1040_cov_4.074480.p2 GENE.NODE_15622_length_1040_cov_4.074480~~NODE_15622_length_1040_cov_4.074480.p2  ORF type:complete len:102 (+),score=9.85 NODE_15622_length_1040_cov_4.074480:410-715(+)